MRKIWSNELHHSAMRLQTKLARSGAAISSTVAMASQPLPSGGIETLISTPALENIKSNCTGSVILTSITAA
jgi:hypothetical protein